MIFKYCGECGHKLEDIKWYQIDEVNDVIARENNCSGMHWDKCRDSIDLTKRQ